MDSADNEKFDPNLDSQAQHQANKKRELREYKLKEKMLLVKIHNENRVIDQIKKEINDYEVNIEYLKQMLENPESIQRADPVYDVVLNNEFNAVINNITETEQKILGVQQKILLRKIEKGNHDGSNEILTKAKDESNKNEELGKKISKDFLSALAKEAADYKTQVGELREKIKRIQNEINELENEQKGENESLSTYKRMLKEAEERNQQLTEEIDLIKKESVKKDSHK